jgi:hypothetical protein
MPIHLMYLVTLAGLVLTVWVIAGGQQAEPAFTAGYYCTGQPDGVRVYAPGRVVEGRAVVIWADTGRLHHIDIAQLTECG